MPQNDVLVVHGADWTVEAVGLRSGDRPDFEPHRIPVGPGIFEQLSSQENAPYVDPAQRALTKTGAQLKAPRIRLHEFPEKLIARCQPEFVLPWVPLWVGQAFHGTGNADIGEPDLLGRSPLVLANEAHLMERPARPMLPTREKDRIINHNPK